MKLSKKMLPAAIALVAMGGTAEAASCVFTNVSVWDTGAFNGCTDSIAINTTVAGSTGPLSGFGLYANGSTWNVAIPLSITTTGDKADGLRSINTADVTLGDGVSILTKGVSADGINATKESSSRIRIGDNAVIATESTSIPLLEEGAHAVRANNSTNGGKNVIQIGDGARISTLGPSSWGVLAGMGNKEVLVASTLNLGGSEVILGDDAAIRTRSQSAYGVYGNTRRSSITLGSGVDIVTDAADTAGVTDAHGIYATNGAQVLLQGSTAIGVNAASNSILAGREAVVRSAGFDDPVAGSANLFNLDGQILANKTKNTDLTNNGANRYLDDRGGLVQLRMGEASLVTRGDWAPGLGKTVVEARNTSVDVQEAGINPGDARIALKAFDQTRIIGDVAALDGAAVDLDLHDSASFTGAAITTGALNLALLGSDTRWNVTRSGTASGLSGQIHASAVNELDLVAGARVNLGAQQYAMANAADRVQLDVQHLQGQGLFEIRPLVNGVGLAAFNDGDLLNVTGVTEGSHQVFIPSAQLGLGNVTVDGLEALKVVQTADGQGGFALAGGQAVDIGHLKYTLKQMDGKNWFLVADAGNPGPVDPPLPPTPDPDPGTDPGTDPTDPSIPDPGPTVVDPPSPSPPAPGPGKPELNNTAQASTRFLNANYLLNYADTQTLLQRMGDLRRTGEGDAWVRTYVGKLSSFADSRLSGFDMDYTGVQLGADRRIQAGDAEFFVGGMLGYTHADPQYRHGRSEVESYNLGLYATYGTTEDFYIDGLVKLFRIDNTLDVRDSQGARVTGDGASNGLTFSMEAGKRFHFDEKRQGWYLEPQGQLSYTHQDALTVKSSSGLRTRMDAYDSILLRASVLGGYNVKNGRTPLNVYLKSGWVQELGGDVDVRYNDSAAERYRFDRGWWDSGIGMTAEFGGRHSLYLEASYAAGRSFDKQQVNLGYRYVF